MSYFYKIFDSHIGKLKKFKAKQVNENPCHKKLSKVKPVLSMQNLEKSHTKQGFKKEVNLITTYDKLLLNNRVEAIESLIATSI